MSESPLPKPTPADWSDALLTSGSEALLGAVRNYIGPVKTPYDKRALVLSLEAFLRRAETRDSLLALIDPLDARIIGSAILIGPAPEQALKDLFVGELPLFELGVRISNLFDRLLLFRYQRQGQRLVAVNPSLEEALSSCARDPSRLLGAEPGQASGPGEGAVDAKTAVALFCHLFHAQKSTRKDGSLTKRAAERAAAILPGLAGSGTDRLGELARSLSASGALAPGEEDERCPDRDAFALLLEKWGEYLPYFLAASLACAAGGSGAGADASQGTAEAETLARVIACALESLPEGLSLPRAAMARWLRIVARRALCASDPAKAIPQLEAFGFLKQSGRALVTAAPGGRAPGMASPAAEAAGAGAAGGPARGLLVAEGAHALHLMPEASLEDRLFVGCVARPVSLATAWSFEIDRDTVRRAFAAGLTTAAIKARLDCLSGTALPQSLAFSLSAWEEEYRSLRLYRGFVLAADDRQRALVERSASLGRIVAEKLAPGVYFLSAGSLDEAVAALGAAGLAAPPLAQAAASRRSGPSSEPGLFDQSSGAASGGAGLRPAIEELRGRIGLPAFSDASSAADPEPRLAVLRAALEASSRSEAERRELADRIERKLVLTERQISQSDPRSERLEAGGLDYIGKVRVVERALRSAGDRLEVLYRLPGEEPVRALLRPVKLEKNEKGLVLEAEDLATGGPARVPLGAVSTVRRVRASLFGEDQ
jgi:hypothetical protein